MNSQDARREELQRLCQDQRDEFIAMTAARTAALRTTRPLRFIIRLLRIIRRLAQREALP